MKSNKKHVTLKLDSDIKDKFKKTANEQGTLMQDLLEIFVKNYIENPQKFIIKKEFKIGVN